MDLVWQARSGVSGPLVWWANRKSKIGLSPAALKPPHLPGQEWWTTPPTAPPQPEHIEYVVQFKLQLMRMKPSNRKNVMQGHVGAWLEAARRLLHESGEGIRGDLLTTDGLLLSALALLREMAARGKDMGKPLPEQFDEVVNALRSRCYRIQRERAVELSKRKHMRTRP